MPVAEGRKTDSVTPESLSQGQLSFERIREDQEGQVPDLYPSSMVSPKSCSHSQTQITTLEYRHNWMLVGSPGHPLWLHLKVALQETDNTGSCTQNALCMPYELQVCSTVPVLASHQHMLTLVTQGLQPLCYLSSTARWGSSWPYLTPENTNCWNRAEASCPFQDPQQINATCFPECPYSLGDAPGNHLGTH